jgi:hypothetical protein
MSKTADDLIYEAGGILGKAVAGESLGSVEYETISGQVDNVLATTENIVAWDRDDIPDRYFKALADLVAAFAAAKFAGTEPDTATVERLEDRLRYLSAPSRTRRTLRIDPAFSPYRRNYYGGSR